MPLLKKTAKLKYIFLKEAENFEQIIIPVSEMIKQTQKKQNNNNTTTIASRNLMYDCNANASTLNCKMSNQGVNLTWLLLLI